MFENRIFLCVMVVLFAVFGSAVAWLNESSAKTYTSLYINLISAVFMGLIVCGFNHMGLSDGMTFVLAGMGGFFGLVTMDYIKQYILKRFGLEETVKEKTVEDFETQALQTEITRRSVLQITHDKQETAT